MDTRNVDTRGRKKDREEEVIQRKGTDMEGAYTVAIFHDY